ncbi:MAG: UDP-N-acetylmuramoyl-L-alanyl-D-glutamate--2,6-diaminopimelate ligase [Saprospiraceae bacterium]|nr:UDP-N-acetylmuramoyl-L-alanyl-D-glutamate--2,6-diaminopimelate ligase [Saprospiraceae bacterium]
MNKRSLKKLADILPDAKEYHICGTTEQTIVRFVFDSRQAGEQIAFVAKRGSNSDGHDFIGDALARGSRVIFCEHLPSELHPEACYVSSNAFPELLGKVLNRFFGYPQQGMTIVGVTGTNGKTTVARLLYELYTGLGHRCGLLSTIENIVGGNVFPATHTTPDQIGLFELLRMMHDAECSYVFMEVSSHAADQGRIDGVEFACGIFTNITHDHLDYHGSFKSYLYAKKTFFDRLNKKAFAIINADDLNAEVMVQNTRAKCVTYGLRQIADHKGRILENTLDGLLLQFDGVEWNARLTGVFNAYNLLAVYTCALCLGKESDEVLERMSGLLPVAGRMELVSGGKSGKTGIVDYAHTPDALEKVITTLLELRKPGQQILTVVGCGGDRDRRKRPVMAEIACMLSDRVVFTSDNPRSESPDDILREMEQAVRLKYSTKYVVVPDREQAIRTACMMAGSDDIVLVAGKGHEKYQEIGGKKLPFDDVEMLKTHL